MRCVLLGALLSAGCGVSSDERTNCNSVTCAGCCDEYGTCVEGNRDDACGVNGARCAECAADSICDPIGICVSLGARAGERCTGNGDCRSGLCQTSWPAGNACATASCSGESSCGIQEACFRSTVSSYSSCVRSCTPSASDCRFEYMCIALIQTENFYVCWPDCRKVPSFCTGGCNTTNGLCR